MKIKEFAQLVAQMRHMQTEHKRSHCSLTGRKVKELEKQVDDILARMPKPVSFVQLKMDI